MKGKYDLILVDGPPGKLRKGILKNLDLFKHVSIPVIFDDINREEDKKIMEKFCDELDFNFHIIEGEKKKFGICLKANEKELLH